jgi:uncharacterized protein (TIGR03435 family)
MRCTLALVSTMLVATAWAQEPVSPGASQPVAFEVASVKRNTSGAGAWNINPRPGGRLAISNAPLDAVIRFAFQLREFQLLGGPGWMRSDRFDIDAAADGDVPFARLRTMLQALLAERFSLVTHRETRELPVHALVLLRPDGRLGTSLQRSDYDCTAARGDTPPKPALASNRPVCGIIGNDGSLVGGSVPMAMIVNALAEPLNGIVVDKTGLAGGFDFEVRWSDADGPSLSTAVQEQLGLKLESQRGPVDVLIVDRVEQPSEN